MTNKEYHIVRGVPSEEFQNTIDKSWTDAKLILLQSILLVEKTTNLSQVTDKLIT
jgi:hypothetical protein